MANATRSRSRRAPAVRAAAAGPAATPDTLDQLLQLRKNLEATRTKLLVDVDPDKLDDAQHHAWAEQVREINNAISGLRNATAQSLADEFAAELPAFEAATKKLNDDLARLARAVDIIKAVAGVLGVVGRILSLVTGTPKPV